MSMLSEGRLRCLLSLRLWLTGLMEVDPDILASGLVTLEELDMVGSRGSGGGLRTDYWGRILTAVAQQGEGRLRRLKVTLE